MRNRLFNIRTIGRLTASAALALILGAGAMLATPQAGYAQNGTPAAKPDISKLAKKDMVIFRNGNKVEGVILEESETTLKMVVIVGTLRSEATYQKSEILEIKRDAFKTDPAKADPAKDAKKDDAKKDDKKADDKADEKKDSADAVDPKKLVDISGKPVQPGALKIYIVTFPGEMGRDVTETPIKMVMDEIALMQPDIVIVRFDQAFGFYGDSAPDYAALGRQSFDFLEKVNELDAMMNTRMEYGSEFKVKPRRIAWVKKALGPAAFLPFAFPEMYFTSDGRLGGIGGLEMLFKGHADDVVAEKQISLRLGFAIGLAEKGGHVDGKVLIRAMSRGEGYLSYRLVGGKPEFLEGPPPSPEWTLLKDDGPVNPEHRDSMADTLRLQGNDYLTLDAVTAMNIDLSKGTADSLEELLSKMGIVRNYAVLKNNSRRIIAQWGMDVNKAEADFQTLYRKFKDIQLKPPGGFKERTAMRTQQKTLLRQMQSCVEKYKEAINPRRIGAPDDIISSIDVRINEIETMQKLDRP